ncbi:MAG TPA: HAMP domain-containing sensor histidine kinase, partial [Gemmatimonadaceae bacterium]|nr:HAMP domain-containing sensor histidine kinase [Gemmatimonadaceae bacterium]
MPTPPNAHLPLPAHRSRSTPLVAILLLTVAIVAFMAYEAWDAARSHRATAERAIRDYASFAAWEFTVNTKEVFHYNVSWVFSPVANLRVRSPHQALPAPSVLASEKTVELQCAEDSARYFFRLDLRDDPAAAAAFVTSGDVPSAAMRAWILDTIPKHARGVYQPDWSWETVFGTVAGRSRGVAYTLKYDTQGRPAAVYGFELCLKQFGAPIFRKVMEKYAMLPPSLTHGARNDSLFSVQVTDLCKSELWRTDVRYASAFTGSFVTPHMGGLTAHVSLRPDVAERLLIGGLPHSRLPLLLGVLALTMGLTGVGLMQLRREGELARMRSDFIASVSHELRTPLAQVRMFAETLLLGRVRSDEERRRSLQIVDQEARRLTHLVENILQFSRAERRAIRLAPAPIDLATHVREAVECFAPIARARRVAVRTELAEGVVAVADPEALRQVLLNLLDNAVKYGPVGQTVTVSAGAAGAGDGRVRVWVEDEGPGIAPKDRERVWEAFVRLDRDANTAIAGSGIGLSVVRELVTLHGGRAWVEGGTAG